jgi:Domain of unknown function (DUF222)/HNH endonuclease
MFETGTTTTTDAGSGVVSRVADALERLAAAQQELLRLDPRVLSRDELLDLLEIHEINARRHTAVGCALIAELDGRGVAGELGYASTGVLLAERLHLGRREAAGRARLAADLGPRRAMTGEVLAPRFPQVGAALAAGAISSRHATVITATVNRLPDAVLTDQPELVAQVEPTLLGYAGTVDPDRLAVLARTVAVCLDPDGQLVAEKDHQRDRAVTLAVLPDGSGRLAATVTAEAAVVWTTILDTLARPVPADDDQSDRRSPAQRRHDALLDAGRRLLRSGALPDCGGAPATVLVTLTVDQLQARTGLATAGHGGLVSIPEALRIAAEADIIPVVVGDAGGVLGYGLTRRVASIGQRRALAARDRGCCFPSCDRPPDWCESHHVTPWVDGGPTDVGNLTLLCGFHHREHHKRGWAVRMRDGLPEWIPPRWIDPTRTPRRNTTHHIAIRFPPPVQPEWKGTTTGDPPRDLAPAYA